MFGATMLKTTALFLAAAGSVLAKAPIKHLGNQGPILCKSSSRVVDECPSN